MADSATGPLVLFVCTGNTCRSPMAEALLRQRFEREERFSGWRVASAGTRPTPGDTISRQASMVLQAEGLDITSHRARRIDESMVRDAALVLALTARQRDTLRETFPAYTERIFTLGEMATREEDVEDPLGKDRAAYESTAAQIDQLIGEGLEEIERRARPKN